jgi:hypothetical protein
MSHLLDWCVGVEAGPSHREAREGEVVGDDATGLTQRELLMEMREDIRGLRASVDAIARDQALGVERRAAMQRSADSIYARLDGHDRDLDRMGILVNGRGERSSAEAIRVKVCIASRLSPMPVARLG